MTKPKHPTVKSLRTGQTIYQVCVNDAGGANPAAFGRQITVGSKRTPYPRLGDWVIEAPVDYLRNILATMPDWLKGYVFYSKKRAERFAKQLEYKLKNRYKYRTVNKPINLAVQDTGVCIAPEDVV